MEPGKHIDLTIILVTTRGVLDSGMTIEKNGKPEHGANTPENFQKLENLSTWSNVQVRWEHRDSDGTVIETAPWATCPARLYRIKHGLIKAATHTHQSHNP